MRLPKTSKSIRREFAAISPADLLAIEALVDGMTADGNGIAGKVTASISGSMARQLWRAGQTGSRFRWDRPTLQFARGNKAVSRATVKAAADAVIGKAELKAGKLIGDPTGAAFRMMDAALRMGQGKMSLAEWAVSHDQQIKYLHATEAALGRGGFAEMTTANWQSVSDRVANQYGYSRAFAEDVARGRYGVPGSMDFREDALLNRANAYANAGRTVYENTLKDAHKDSGFGFARRILAAVNHCDSCAEVAAHGWYPIDEYPEIGTDSCFSNCWCVTIFSRTGDD